MKAIKALSSEQHAQVIQICDMASRNYYLNSEKIESLMHNLRIMAVSRLGFLPAAVYSNLELSGSQLCILSLRNQIALTSVDVSNNPGLKLSDDFIPASVTKLLCRDCSIERLNLAKTKLLFLDISGNSQFVLVQNALPPYLETLLACGDSIKSLDLRKHRNLRELDFSDNRGLVLFENALPCSLCTLRANGDSVKALDFTGLSAIRHIEIVGNDKCQLFNLKTTKIDFLDCSFTSCMSLNLSCVKVVRKLIAAQNTNLQDIWLPAKIEHADFTGCTCLHAAYGVSKIKVQTPNGYVERYLQKEPTSANLGRGCADGNIFSGQI